LFGSFAGSTGLSDFPWSSIKGLPPLAFPSRPAKHRSATPRTIPDGASSTLTGNHWISRFSRMELVVRAWVLRPRRVHQRLAKTPPAVSPSAYWQSVGTLN